VWQLHYSEVRRINDSDHENIVKKGVKETRDEMNRPTENIYDDPGNWPQGISTASLKLFYPWNTF